MARRLASPAPAAKDLRFDGRVITLSNPDKVLYPAGFTKAQVLDCYRIRSGSWTGRGYIALRRSGLVTKRSIRAIRAAIICQGVRLKRPAALCASQFFCDV